MSIIEKAVDRYGKDEPQKREPQLGVEGAVPRVETAEPVAVQEVIAPRTAEVRNEAPTPSAAPGKTATINLIRLRNMGMIAPDADKTQLAEEFRLIKRPLLMNAFGQGAEAVKNGKLVMVTSSLPGEGKTFCSINLAISIAMEMNRTVLLVDADVAKPSVPRLLDIQAERGLLDVLDEKLPLPDVLIRTNIENLVLLPAGRTHRRATELLASEAMNRLLHDLSTRYPDRIIIFDSPPLLSTSEASVLAAHMGQIVLVVEAEQTPEAALKEALGQLSACDVVGLLLNKGNSLTGADGGYRYGYGSYGVGAAH